MQVLSLSHLFSKRGNKVMSFFIIDIIYVKVTKLTNDTNITLGICQFEEMGLGCKLKNKSIVLLADISRNRNII